MEYGTWDRGGIERQLLGTIAMAVQRGNAMAMLVGYTRAAQMRGSGRGEGKVGEELEEHANA